MSTTRTNAVDLGTLQSQFTQAATNKRKTTTELTRAQEAADRAATAFTAAEAALKGATRTVLSQAA